MIGYGIDMTRHEKGGLSCYVALKRGVIKYHVVVTCTSSGTKSLGTAPSAPSRMSEKGSWTARKSRQKMEDERMDGVK